MAGRRYCLVVDGELGPRYKHAFEGMTLTAGDGKTELIGPIADQAHLHGLLERIGSLGLTLRSVTSLDPDVE